MTTRAWNATTRERDEAGSPRPLFVLVDASSASQRAVEMALRLAQMRRSEIVLVDVLPQPAPEGELEPEAVSAALMASELGYGVLLPAPVADEEARTTRRLRAVLLPLKKQVEAAGVATSLRLVHGAEPCAEIRRLLAAESTEAALVLPNPLELYGPLRGAATSFMFDPPCTVYLASRANQAGVPFGRVMVGLMRSVWRRLAR